LIEGAERPNVWRPVGLLRGQVLFKVEMRPL
jgi:hypothetical protein